MTDDRRCDTCGLIPILDLMEIHERDCREWIVSCKTLAEFVFPAAGSRSPDVDLDVHDRRTTALWNRLLVSVLPAAHYRLGNLPAGHYR